MYKNFLYFVDLVGMKVSPSELTDVDDTTNLTMGCTKSDATDGSKDVAQNTVPILSLSYSRQSFSGNALAPNSGVSFYI